MVTPLALLIAIIVFCVVVSALMILVMLLASPTPAWYRRLNFGSVVFGLFMVAFGIFQISIARKGEQTHRVSYYRGAPVTPSQSYAAGIGLISLGAIAAVSALLHRQTMPNDS
ncbi:MAG: hypothetical protein WAO00_08300 [Chthoniobacterales bacterium]